MLNDILLSVYLGDYVILLDFSAAFNTIDHRILIWTSWTIRLRRQQNLVYVLHSWVCTMIEKSRRGMSALFLVAPNPGFSIQNGELCWHQPNTKNTSSPLTLWLCSDSCHTCGVPGQKWPDSKQLLINLSLCYIITKYWIQSFCQLVFFHLELVLCFYLHLINRRPHLSESRYLIFLSEKSFFYEYSQYELKNYENLHCLSH